MSTSTPSSIWPQNARIGFWSAILFAILLTTLNITFAVMALQVPVNEWQGMEVYANTYQIISFVPQTIGLFTIPPLLLMLISIYLYSEERRKIWGLAGLLFGTVYAGLLGALYFIQVAVVLPALIDGNWQGLDQFTFANPRSIAWGLDHFAWSLLGVALFFMAWVFESNRLNRWIRSLFIINGFGNILLIFAFAFDIEILTLIIAFASWVIALPVAAVLVGLMFRKIRTAP
jgi:hypothetical protein